MTDLYLLWPSAQGENVWKSLSKLNRRQYEHRTKENMRMQNAGTRLCRKCHGRFKKENMQTKEHTYYRDGKYKKRKEYYCTKLEEGKNCVTKMNFRT